MRRWIKRMLGVICILVVLLAVMIAVNGWSTDLPARSDATLRVASHNVHYIILRRETGPWSVGDWEERKNALDAAFKSIDADVIGFQEMESFQRGDGSVNLALDWLIENNPEYRAAAVGDWQTFPITQPILYRADRLTALDQGWFFFSDTPDVIYARTFNGSFPAFASWAEFDDPVTGRFKVVNVHFEYSSASNRLKSAALVVDRIKPWIDAGETVFLIGDLNALRGSRTMRRLETAGLTFFPIWGSSFHFNRGLNLFGPIDHLAVSDGVSAVSRPVAVRGKFEGDWPSDHYPVVGDFVRD